MAPTLVDAAVGALLAAALLGSAFDRRSLLVVVGAAVLPSLDAAFGLVAGSATNAALHNLWLPGLAAGVLYWDTGREDSWLRDRHGWRGVRVAWVALAAFVVAGIGLAVSTDAGANLLYPVHDRFYALSGELVLSSRDGLEQTYVTVGDGSLLSIGSPGTTATHHVPSWIDPTPATGLQLDAERRLVLVESGWQAVLVLVAAIVTAARTREVRD